LGGTFLIKKVAPCKVMLRHITSTQSNLYLYFYALFCVGVQNYFIVYHISQKSQGKNSAFAKQKRVAQGLGGVAPFLYGSVCSPFALYCIF